MIQWQSPRWVGLSLSLLLGVFLVGCLKTRTEIRDSVARKDEKAKLAAIQKANAQAKEDEEANQVRELIGRVEVLETQLAEAQERKRQAEEQSLSEEDQVQQKFKAYEESLAAQEAELQSLRALVQQMQKSPAPKKVNKGTFATAEAAFNKKDWKAAILGYQKYRDKYPKGRRYSEATYKIGVSFQELGMKAEAKSFYEEVIEKFPKGSTAKSARYRLKNL